MTPYRFLYRFGITPWDGEEVPEPLRDLVARRDGAAGRALDIGCGTGRDAVFLAERGWSVTGVDNVQQPLEAARERARSAGVNVTWVDGDVAKLDALAIGDGYDLLLDRGCFHGLSDSDRASCATGMTAVASPGASLLLFAFQPRRGLGPRGITSEGLSASLGAQWQLLNQSEGSGDGLPWWLGRTRPTWYEFRRL